LNEEESVKLFPLTEETNKRDYLIVVSGLPRSGTSMMMNMLEVGGLPLLTDHMRTADIDNPKGYYEFERVKKLEEGDNEWVKDAKGRVVKVISNLLEFLPSQYSYKVIFMERYIQEVLASQKEMLLRRGEDSQKVADEQIAYLFSKHLAKVKAWLSQQPNISVLYVSYNEILEDPEIHLANINRFLGGGLDIQKMSGIIDAVLYRHRSGSR
jgi:hypothetical protein